MELSGCRASWDFFTEPGGLKTGRIRELGTQTAVLCCSEPIDSRRWVRVVMHAGTSGLARAAYARVTDQYEMIDLWEDDSLTLYRHELEWIRPFEPEWVNLLTPTDWNLCECTNLIPKTQKICGLCALRVVISG